MVARTQVLAEFAAAFEEIFGSLTTARAFVDAAEAKDPANLIAPDGKDDPPCRLDGSCRT
jgi:hypothetical protein